MCAFANIGTSHVSCSSLQIEPALFSIFWSNTNMNTNKNTSTYTNLNTNKNTNTNTNTNINTNNGTPQFSSH